MEQTFQPRQIAYIVEIKDISNGVFVRESGFNPNYVKIGSKNVSRINIIGTVIDKKQEGNSQNLIIDDGTGRIAIKEFEKNFDVSIGDVVLLVGRVRQFNDEKYVAPEIIRKNIDSKWNFVWKKFAIKSDGVEVRENVVVNEPELKEDSSKNSIETILSRMKELDNGSGSPYEEIVKSPRDKELISHLILQGEVFEVSPGRLKVLE